MSVGSHSPAVTGSLGLTVRTWLRYLVPLTILSVIALAVVGMYGWRVGAARDIVAARLQVRLGWTLVGFAGVLQLLLVAGVAPAVRSVASGRGISQIGALASGVIGMVRAVVPWLVAVIAIAIGSLALILPGLLVLVAVSMTGASERLAEPLPLPITDSIAATRGNFMRIAMIVGLMLAVDVAIGGIAQTTIVHALKQPTTTAALLATRRFVHVVAGSLIAFSPLPACALASAYLQRRRTR